MADGSLIEAYLETLRKALRSAAPVSRELQDEVRDHLLSAVEAEVAAGVAPLEAERTAIARFGAPEVIARDWLLERRRASFGGPTLAAFLAIAGVAVLQRAVQRLFHVADWHATRLLQISLLTAWPLLALHLGRRWLDRLPRSVLVAAIASGWYAASVAIASAVVHAVLAGGWAAGFSVDGVHALTLVEFASALVAKGGTLWCAQWTRLAWRAPSPAGS